MKRLIIISLCCFIELSLKAQEYRFYRYESDLLPKGFHQSRRMALRSDMPANSVAFLFANPERNRSNDVDFQYQQDPDFYYLTGFIEPNSLLIIFKEDQNVYGRSTNEILFVPDRNPGTEVWTGRRAGKEGADELLGIRTTELASSFDSLVLDIKKFSKILYRIPMGVVDDRTESDDLYDLLEAFKKKVSFPPENGDTRLLHALLAGLREIKQPEEMVLLRKAINISCDAHIEMMKAAATGMDEYQVQAVGEYVFKRSGSEYVGYPSICGGGENATIIHYMSNRKKLSDGDLILLDMGAEYHGYTADITRTLPVNGRFSDEQRIIYELVLKAQEEGFRACLPGNAFNAPHQAAVAVIQKGLMDLEIIKRPEDYRRHFMHGTSHYLGLDVHDAGTMGPLKNGNVITVEPGVYIAEGSPCDPKWWNIGIRIEDDILITATGFENLSVKVPRLAAEVEKRMKETPLFVK